MCLQIYIKRDNKYFLNYIPDAKAFTDAPPSLLVLLKQRRRWMNGALFGGFRVLRNFHQMIGCTKTTHSIFQNLQMLFFMSYYFLMLVMSLTMLGSFYIGIKIFFTNLAKELQVSNIVANSELFAMIFTIFYAVMLVSIILCSLCIQVNKTITLFKFINIIFSLITLSSLVGVGFMVVKNGFFYIEATPTQVEKDVTRQVEQCDKHGKCQMVWVTTREIVTELVDKEYFSKLTLFGLLVLASYIMPFVLRPIDFLKNAHHYVIGLICYILLLPFFSNIMQIYSMCNLHDVSWGNRPTIKAGDAKSAEQIKADRLKASYISFKYKFLVVWIILNIGYAVLVERHAQQIAEQGGWGFIEIFAAYLGLIVVYRLVFGFLHIVHFKFKKNCTKQFRTHKVDLLMEYQQLREAQDWQKSVANFKLEEQLRFVMNDQRLLLDNSLGIDKVKKAKTFFNNDDDDEEFEGAQNEELQDTIDNHNSTNYMISRVALRKLLSHSTFLNSISLDETKINIREAHKDAIQKMKTLRNFSINEEPESNKP